ncbi:MAG TPA: DNA-3-methyladenine glycosylase [Anaeromyxobacter sp.]
MATRTSSKLPRAFYARDTRAVARDLLGKVLVHVDGGVRRAARIVETEAYHGPDDRASHARFGRTRRAGVMFGPPGVAYVYLIYGRSHCMNVVTGEEGFPAAVLLRAGEPVEGCLHGTRGPGNLCRALAIRREHDDGRDLVGDDLFFLDAPPPPERILSARRVNVDYAGPSAEKPWRYALAENPWVSRPPLAPAPARRRSPAGARDPRRGAPPRRTR